MKRVVLHTLLMLAWVVEATAARANEPSEPTAASVDQSDRPKRHPWSLEVDVLQPFIPTVGIIRPKVTRTLWGSATGLRGDLVVGLWIRPHIEHDVVDHIDEYMGSVGYRQYVWRGLHAETIVNAGAAWGTNLVDGRFYRTPTLFLDVNVGYRFGFFEAGGIVEGHGSNVGFFVSPQAGVLTTLGVSDIGPRNGKPDVFLQGTLLVGASF